TPRDPEPRGEDGRALGEAGAPAPDARGRHDRPLLEHEGGRRRRAGPDGGAPAREVRGDDVPAVHGLGRLAHAPLHRGRRRSHRDGSRRGGRHDSGLRVVHVVGGPRHGRAGAAGDPDRALHRADVRARRAPECRELRPGGLPLAVVPLPFTNQTPRDIQGMAERAFDQVQAGLTRPVEAAKAVERPPLDERLRYDGDDLLDAWGRMQTDFLARGWSDGFPLVPPTERAVAALLRSTRRGPADPIATLEPGFGIATVEKLAINAVMAGCGPEHLPLLIAAVRCLAEPKMYIRNKAMSTGPHAPLVLVNGPKGRAANLNSGMCALGPGAPSASNTVLGRAVRLTMMNVGHTYVGVSDMDTIGSPLKYSLCCAENEAESPWEPYHVSRGFARDASTITVHFVYGICELHDFRSTAPDDLVQVFATAATNVAQVGTGLWLIGRRADPRSKTEEKEHNTLFICP